MNDIKVYMKDGSVKDFPDKKWTSGYNQVLYQGVFAVIVTPSGEKISIPAADIKEIKESGINY